MNKCATLIYLIAVCGVLLVRSACAEMPQLQHVFVLVEENQSYQDVIGNDTDMPYLNSLAKRYGLATNYFADTHPSINNYFYLTAGRRGTSFPFVGVTADIYPFDVEGPNVASLLSQHGKTWKAYAESLPHAGYIGRNRGLYAKRHVPFAYFGTVRDRKKERRNIVPFTQLATDLNKHALPDYGFIVPNLYHDGHNDQTTHSPAGCGDHQSMQVVDRWLQENIEPLISSPDFQSGGLLVITFDEACDTGPHADSRLYPKNMAGNGGGHVATLLISSRIVPGTKCDALYHHESVLRSALEALGVDTFPGEAANAPDLSAFFDPTACVTPGGTQPGNSNHHSRPSSSSQGH